jgi:hypothetical protein
VTSPLIAGHDTTLSAILAALLGDSWDQRWPPYASLLSIELYESIHSNTYSFRLIYNGQPLLVPGCSSPLCDIQILLTALAFGRNGHIAECSSRPHQELQPQSDQPQEVDHQLEVLFSTGEWILIASVMSILSSLFGALLYMTAVHRTAEESLIGTGGGRGGHERRTSAVSQSYDAVPVHERL